MDGFLFYICKLLLTACIKYILYKPFLTPSVICPAIGVPGTMDAEGRIFTLKLKHFFVTQVYTPNAGEGLKRLDKRQMSFRPFYQ